jgi:DNA-binding transcriptional LysR family regulator
LPAHALIMGPASVTANWTFRRGGTTTSVRVDGRIRIAGNEGAIAAAVAGLGVIMTSSGAVRRETEGGELVRILDDWDLGAHELKAVFAGGCVAKPAARALAGYLAAALKDA